MLLFHRLHITFNFMAHQVLVSVYRRFHVDEIASFSLLKFNAMSPKNPM
uniref:Uncharacterized protein n=1 Tax=Arundo donax TaxID=35708 RepID=A0A0A9HPL5_ARUDO